MKGKTIQWKNTANHPTVSRCEARLTQQKLCGNLGDWTKILQSGFDEEQMKLLESHDMYSRHFVTSGYIIVKDLYHFF